MTLVYVLVAAWLILGGLLARGLSRWFRFMRGDFDAD